MWEYCGMSRNEAGLIKAKKLLRELREEFWENAIVPGLNNDFNQSLERAGRVADFLEFSEIAITDALARKESCGCHFNEAYQTEENEAKRDDKNFAHVAAWEYVSGDRDPVLHKETLVFENVELTTRSYK
jgi:succinate dehydrogenase / fumarate reductase flavoprotein subunit